MEFIRNIDNIWHEYNKEMPPRSVRVVEFLDNNGNIHKGGISVEMSGFYPYIVDEKYERFKDWASPDLIKSWRFIKDREYIDYK